MRFRQLETAESRSRIATALKLYDKYRSNLKEKIKLLESGRLFEWGEERELLLAEMDEGDFYSFINEFQEFLKKVVKAFGYA